MDTTNVFSAVDALKLKFVNFATDYGMQVVGAIIILVIGFAVARWLGNLLRRWLDRHQLEPPVKTLFVRVVRLAVMVMTLVMVLDKFGVPITTLVAGIGVAGVGVGLALQGVLSNLVAGLTIIFTKPYRVGEYIHITGVQGQVQTIELFSTVLLHNDLSKVVIPNRKIVGEILHNYGSIRQANLTVGVAYGTNLGEAFKLIREILAGNPRVLKDPAPVVSIAGLADSSVNLAVNPWVAITDFRPAQIELYQAILDGFRAQNIQIPFPQREVRLLQ